MSRSEVLTRLRRESLVVLAAKHRLGQAEAEVVAAGVWTNPNISASSVMATHGAVTGGRTELVVAVDQTLPIGGQVGLRKDVARGYQTAEERAFAATLWSVLCSAKIAYLDVQRAEARARLVRNALTDLDRVEAIVTERAAAGATSPYDRARVAAERSKLEARRAQANVDVTAAKVALAETVGSRSLDAVTMTADEAIDEPADPPGDVGSLVRRALASRPEVESARARADATELRITSLRRQYVPSPNVSVGYARFFNVPDAAGLSGGALVVGLSAPIPILDHGQGTVDRGIAASAEERANRDAVELGIRLQVEQAATAAKIRIDAWHRFRDGAARDFPRLRTIAELSYREGRATILELLDAYSTFIDGQERALDLRVAASRSALDLERAVGPSGRNP